MAKISVITPCYFNEPNIPVYAKRMIDNEQDFPDTVTFEYVLIDDGSKDNTWAELQKFYGQYPNKVKIIKLERNFGATNAIYAGLNYATGDCNVVVAADLQDPPELIARMYEYWLKGFKLVLANRASRDESALQQFMSNTTHKMIRKWGIKNLPDGGFDLSLFDKEIRDVIVKIDDKNSFFPYLLLWLGYEYVSIPYVRQKREIGKSSYTVAKKIKIFVDSFVAFSYFPVRIISISGLALGMLSFLYAILIITWKIMGKIETTGWSSIMVIILFVASFQMISLGIIGKYVWAWFDAARKRPNFIIEKTFVKENTP